MEGAEWLRTHLASYGCSSCGRPYRSRGIRILAHRDDLYFVDLSCRACGAGAVAIVTVEIEGGEPQVDAPELAPATTPGAPPIASDDVLDMHEFLRDFDGDFRSLFTGTGREPDATAA